MGILQIIKQLFSNADTSVSNSVEADQPAIPIVISTPVVKGNDPLDSREEYFINKGCRSLDDFIINEDINALDLQKLAWLNGISLQIRSGWYDLLKKLVIELHQVGWDKRVSCIKEKYAELRFHAQGFDEIIDRYTEDSKTVCETCGERGKIRSPNGWDYGACRKHYIETRASVVITADGFTHDGKSCYWKDVVSVGFADEPNYYGDYHLLKVTFKQTVKVSNSGWGDNILYIRSNDYGWGAFLAAIAGRYSNLDEAYLAKFNNASFCKTCGYKAVYSNKCECCEERIYSPKDHSHYDDEQDYYKHQQLYWYDDEGDVYEAMAPHYPQSADYVKLVTDEEVEQHRRDMKTLYD